MRGGQGIKSHTFKKIQPGTAGPQHSKFSSAFLVFCGPSGSLTLPTSPIFWNLVILYKGEWVTWLELPRALINDTQLLECNILFLWLELIPLKVYNSGWLREPCQELLPQPLQEDEWTCVCVLLHQGMIKWSNRRSEKWVEAGIPSQG